MTQHVDAIYDKGVLKPLAPLDLNDQDIVSLAVERRDKAGENPVRAGQTLFDVFAEAGLIGCVKDAPPDLSTNPEYMDGFGTSGQ